jgi:hypothetical protein
VDAGSTPAPAPNRNAAKEEEYMSDAISRVCAHFDALTPKKITVSEWGNLEIHATPITVAEQKRIYGGKEDASAYDIVIEVLIVKAKDAKGQPLFTIADRPALLNHADPAVVARVAGEILNSAAPKADELGNS